MKVQRLIASILTTSLILFSSYSAVAIAPTSWTKYVSNPVLDVGPTSSWDSGSVGTPSILFKDGNYQLWYHGNTSQTDSRIGLATSPDGVQWIKSISNPVLTVGAPGSWDSVYVMAPHAIFHDSMYKMWYRGTDSTDPSARPSIGYATSLDGISWVKYAGNPVLSPGSPGSWDGQGLWSAYVIIEESVYKMWYSAYDGSNFRIGYATSPDGVAWTKYASNPVLDVGSSGSWDNQYVYYPNVIFNGSSYEMWYSGMNTSNSFGIGCATSADGIDWNRHPNNPVLDTGFVGDWDSNAIFASPVLVQAGTYKLWYTGLDASWVSRIGYATSSSFTIYLPLVQKVTP